MTIFLDFDRTLFDTERFYSKLERSFLLLPALLAREGSLQEFLYPDTLPFLEAHKDHDLVLVTRGIPVLQRLKAEKSGVLAFIPHALYVPDGTKAEAIRRHLSVYPLKAPAFFLDDVIHELEVVRSELPEITCIRMRRPGARTSVLAGPPFPELGSLEEFESRFATLEASDGFSKE